MGVGGICDLVFTFCRERLLGVFFCLIFFTQLVCLNQEPKRGHGAHCVYMSLLNCEFLLCSCDCHFLFLEMYFSCKFFHSLNFANCIPLVDVVTAPLFLMVSVHRYI